MPDEGGYMKVILSDLFEWWNKYSNSSKNIENYLSVATDWKLNKSDWWKLIAIAPNCKRMGRWIEDQKKLEEMQPYSNFKRKKLQLKWHAHGCEEDIWREKVYHY